MAPPDILVTLLYQAVHFLIFLRKSNFLILGDEPRSAVAGSSDEDDVGVTVADDPIQVRVEQIQPWVVPQCPSSRGLTCSGTSDSRNKGFSSR